MGLKTQIYYIISILSTNGLLLETTAELFPFNKIKICYFMLEGMEFENKDEST